MEAWYALYTKPHSELGVECTLNARGFVTFLPLLPASPGKRVTPLFLSYLFVNCDLAVTGVSTLKWTPGLARVLTFEGKPAIVPDRAIEMIREGLARIEREGGLPSHPFKPGDEVIVDDGPLAGLSGIFQGPLGPGERVHILLHFLGQSNRAEVPVSMLRSASEAGEQRWPRRGTRGRRRRIQYASDASP
jgi:transcriptional antiterminator RfaH